MPKFSGPQATPAGGFPVRTVGPAVTFEGAPGWERDAKSELFLLAVTNMVGEDTFYESAATRDLRFRGLVEQVAKDDPDWLLRFTKYLRDTAQMRSASIVLAAEYVAAGGPNGRRVVDAACSRPDEPAEVFGYWLSAHGRRLPMPLKRGIADAACRLYNERAALKYDGLSRSVRMGDVIELAHPKPKSEWQSHLFKWLLDRRHRNGEAPAPHESLTTARAALALEATPEGERRGLLANPDALADAGFTWERLSGWLPGGMDAEAWEAVIPQMGYMALLRNLRNFDEANVSPVVKAQVAAKLADPAEVRRSRQFPYRFLTAYKSVPSLEWAATIERALEESVSNVPEFPGRTLVLVDLSGSMNAGLSGRSVAMRWEVGALFGVALAKRNRADLIGFGTDSGRIDFPASAAVLRVIDDIGKVLHGGQLGWGTNIWEAVGRWFDGHDRIVIFTDEQGHDSHPTPARYTHIFNLAGYATATMPSGPGRFSYGGFNDAMFRLMPILENVGHADWPF